METDLEKLRKEINKIDNKLLKLFNQRANIAIGVGEYKKMHGGKTYRSERESEVLKSLMDKNTGPLNESEILDLFRSVITSGRRFQEKISIATLGPKGTWSEIAAKKIFGKHASENLVSTIKEIFEKVASGNSQYGVVPIENSVEGAVNETIDCLRDFGLFIQGEFCEKIEHSLLGSKNIKMGNIKKIIAHPQALAQCKNWIEKNLRGVDKEISTSNAEAAKKALNTDGAVAIASKTLAEFCDLTLLAENITDRADNKTRFIIIGEEKTQITGNDKTSYYFETKNETGALLNVLISFKKANINMTFLVARPTKGLTGDILYMIHFWFSSHNHSHQHIKLFHLLSQQCLVFL